MACLDAGFGVCEAQNAHSAHTRANSFTISRAWERTSSTPQGASETRSLYCMDLMYLSLKGFGLTENSP